MSHEEKLLSKKQKFNTEELKRFYYDMQFIKSMST